MRFQPPNCNQLFVKNRTVCHSSLATIAWKYGLAIFVLATSVMRSILQFPGVNNLEEARFAGGVKRRPAVLVRTPRQTTNTPWGRAIRVPQTSWREPFRFRTTD